MEAIKVERLSKHFDGVLALNKVSFSVEAGEKLCIIGPNGAGKTTLFNLLNGQLSASAGNIYLFGKKITGIPTHLRFRLGQARSFQISSLFLNLSVIENIMIALHGNKRSKFQMIKPLFAYDEHLSKSKRLLESIGLWEKKDQPVHAISYGEQRKMEIVLCQASEPKLLLLDEPSSGLTVAESADMIETIRNMGKDITVLLIAHDMDLVFGLAERIIVLHYGQIIAEGTPEEIQVDSKVKEIYIGSEEEI